MSSGIPRRASVSSQKIAELVFDSIFPALQGQPIDAMVLSLICAAILAMKPNVEQDELQRIILETSGFIINNLQEPADAVH